MTQARSAAAASAGAQGRSSAKEALTGSAKRSKTPSLGSKLRERPSLQNGVPKTLG